MTAAAAATTPQTSPHFSLGLARGMGMVLAGLAAAALLGAYPTWSVYGWHGLTCGAWAAGINVVVFAISVAATCWVARVSGPTAAGKAFMFSGVLRIALLGGAAVLAARVLGIEDNAFWLWAGGLYMVMVIMEALWVAGGAAAARKGGN
jgi:hypothetical protein